MHGNGEAKTRRPIEREYLAATYARKVTALKQVAEELHTAIEAPPETFDLTAVEEFRLW